MAKGYWIGHVSVTNPDMYPEYVAANAAAFEKYGGRFLIRGGKAELLEGASRDRHVVIEFASYERAVECYHSPEYQHALKIRLQCAQGDLVVVEGYDP